MCYVLAGNTPVLVYNCGTFDNKLPGHWLENCLLPNASASRFRGPAHLRLMLRYLAERLNGRLLKMEASLFNLIS